MHWTGFRQIGLDALLSMPKGATGCILVPLAESSAVGCDGCGSPLGRHGQWVEEAHGGSEPQRRHLWCAGANSLDGSPGSGTAWAMRPPNHRPIFFESRGGPFSLPEVPSEKHGPLLNPGGGYLYVVRTRKVPALYVGATRVSIRHRFFTHMKNYGGRFAQTLAAYLENHPDERSSAGVVVFRLDRELDDAEGIFIATLQPLLNIQHKRDSPRPILRLDERAGVYSPD